MTAQPDLTPSVLSTLQSEVSSEASPMLQFLVRHALALVMVFALFIAAIAGYWIYAWQAGARQTEDAKALGAIVVVNDPATRLAKLEAYLKDAPDSTRRAAWFTVMSAARQMNDYQKLHEAWKTIRAFDPALNVPATLGMASALSAQNKPGEALALLDGISANLPPADSMLVNTQIASLAETLGDNARALKACDALVKLPDSIADVTFWTQKKAALELKIAGQGKS